MAEMKTGRARTCPNHEVEWEYPNRYYKCLCAMDKWTWERAMSEADAEAQSSIAPLIVLDEDDGYHD